jgi:hypothetical protein
VRLSARRERRDSLQQVAIGTGNRRRNQTKIQGQAPIPRTTLNIATDTGMRLLAQGAATLPQRSGSELKRPP